jgi:sulfur carrier protein ThiS
MKVNVKLYGTLNVGVAGYDHAHGLELVLHEGATIADLLAELGIASSKRPVAAIDGRIRKKDHRILKGSQIQIFQPAHGG